jgi:hypothetical protein
VVRLPARLQRALGQRQAREWGEAATDVPCMFLQNRELVFAMRGATGLGEGGWIKSVRLVVCSLRNASAATARLGVGPVRRARASLCEGLETGETFLEAE